MYIQLKMHTEDLQIAPKFTKTQALKNVKARFFFLFVYSVFIVIVFGLFFHLDKGSTEALGRNIKIVFFQDIAFNVCIMIALVREIIQIRTASLNRNAPIPSFSAMSGNLLTLHLSIILGAFLWAITSGKFTSFSFSLGSFNKYAIILPFFIVKFCVDIYQINHQDKNKKSLLDNLQKR